MFAPQWSPPSCARRWRTTRKAAAIAIKASAKPPTPTPIPAFAPVLRPVLSCESVGAGCGDGGIDDDGLVVVPSDVVGPRVAVENDELDDRDDELELEAVVVDGRADDDTAATAEDEATFADDMTTIAEDAANSLTTRVGCDQEGVVVVG